MSIIFFLSFPIPCQNCPKKIKNWKIDDIRFKVTMQLWTDFSLIFFNFETQNCPLSTYRKKIGSWENKAGTPSGDNCELMLFFESLMKISMVKMTINSLPRLFNSCYIFSARDQFGQRHNPARRSPLCDESL